MILGNQNALFASFVLAIVLPLGLIITLVATILASPLALFYAVCFGLNSTSRVSS